jgi:iron complex transport system substrate-binding protein
VKKIFFLLYFLCATAKATCSVIDDAGNKIQLTKPAQRIISLAPGLTEILFAIGVNSALIGTVDSSDYPPAALKITRIGSYSGLDLERLISLHPDLIVTWGNYFARQLDVLKKEGIPVYVTDPHQLTDIPRTMRNLGCLTQTTQTAAQQAQLFSKRLALLNQQYDHQKPVRVFYQIGSYSLFTINQDSWINQVIRLCGGRNLFAKATLRAPQISWESVIMADPQVIISDSAPFDWKKRWLAWPKMSAVQHQALFTINPNIIDRAGPRLIEGAKQICQDIALARAKVQ